MFWTVLVATFAGVLLALLAAPTLRKWWRQQLEARERRALDDISPIHAAHLREAAAGNAAGIVMATVSMRALGKCRESLLALPRTPGTERELARLETTAAEQDLMDICALLVQKYGRGLTSRGEQYLRDCAAAIEAAQRDGTI